MLTNIAIALATTACALVAIGIALMPLMLLTGFWAHTSGRADQAAATRIQRLLKRR